MEQLVRVRKCFADGTASIVFGAGFEHVGALKTNSVSATVQLAEG